MFRTQVCPNKEEEKAEGNNINTKTGTIKVSRLNHKRAKKSDPRLDWEMFHKIYHMYSDIKNKEETNADLMLTSKLDHKDINQISKTTVKSHENYQKEFNFQVRRIVPPEIHQIRPRDTQVWNCDEIGFEPNGKWHKVLCTYKLFQEEII